ncbi:MAG: hypothetical protein ACR2PZ_10190 [Pseudomonadales bacterium]
MSTTVFGLSSLLLLAGSMALWFRGIKNVAVPKNRSVYIVVWLAAAALGIVSLAGGVGWLGGIPATLAAVGGLLFTVLVGISRQITAADAVAVGDIIPSFSAPDEDGAIFSSASLAGSPALIKFFRGHW